MSNRQLTPEQCEMAERNHNLIYDFLWKRHLDTDEWYGTAAIGLCKACMAFDPLRNTLFSTLAYKCMQNEVMQERKKRRPETVSIETDITESITLGDMLGAECDFTDVEMQSIKSAFIHRLTDAQKLCFCKMTEGLKSCEAARELGISRQRANQLYNEIRKKYRRFCEVNGIADSLPK